MNEKILENLENRINKLEDQNQKLFSMIHKLTEISAGQSDSLIEFGDILRELNAKIIDFK